MSEHCTTKEYKSIRLEWKKQFDEYFLQQLDPTQSLLNNFLEQLWLDSKNMIDLLTTTATESCNLIMQDYCFKQMKDSLYTRQRLFDILGTETISNNHIVASSSSSSSLSPSSSSSLSFSSCMIDSDSISKNSSKLDNTPLLTNSISSSAIEVNSITQTELDQDQIGTKQKEEEHDSIFTINSSITDSNTKRSRLSPSPSTPTLGKSYTSSCEASFLPACNYLCYYPTYNSKKDQGGANTCHFCNEPITPLKKSFSMGDFSNRQLADDDSSFYTLDESTTFTDDHTSNSSNNMIGDNEIVINSNEFQPLLPLNKDESNMEYCLITPTKTEDRYLYYSKTLSSSSSITQGKQQQQEEEEEVGYKHLSSLSKGSDDDDSLDSIIQKHQAIISNYSLSSNSSKKKRRSMLRLFSHKKISSFFSIKKKKKVDSISSFYQKKMSELLI